MMTGPATTAARLRAGANSPGINGHMRETILDAAKYCDKLADIRGQLTWIIGKSKDDDTVRLLRALIADDDGEGA